MLASQSAVWAQKFNALKFGRLEKNYFTTDPYVYAHYELSIEAEVDLECAFIIQDHRLKGLHQLQLDSGASQERFFRKV